jgi:hypothetical protein
MEITMLKPVLALIALVFATTAAFAQVYQWRGPDGRVHFGDQPPPGSSATLLRPGAKPAQPAVEPGSEPVESGEELAESEDEPVQPEAPVEAERPDSAQPVASPTPEQEADALRAQREEAQAKAALAEAERKRAEALEQDCQRAQNQLVALEGGQRIARLNEKGEREVLDDAARAQEATRMRDFLGEHCSNR